MRPQSLCSQETKPQRVACHVLSADLERHTDSNPANGSTMPRHPDEPKRVITATIEELSDSGPESLSVGRIALRAGLPLHAVERHFPDMAVLLRAAVEHVVEETIQRAIDELPATASPAAQLGIF